jgi:hypothetical protein
MRHARQVRGLYAALPGGRDVQVRVVRWPAPEWIGLLDA